MEVHERVIIHFKNSALVLNVHSILKINQNNNKKFKFTVTTMLGQGTVILSRIWVVTQFGPFVKPNLDNSDKISKRPNVKGPEHFPN